MGFKILPIETSFLYHALFGFIHREHPPEVIAFEVVIRYVTLQGVPYKVDVYRGLGLKSETWIL